MGTAEFDHVVLLFVIAMHYTLLLIRRDYSRQSKVSAAGITPDP